MLLEGHGTAKVPVRRGDAMITSAMQAEQQAIEIFRSGQEIRRVYAYDHGGGVLAVWVRRDNGEIRCLGRSPALDGVEDVPFLNPYINRIVSTVLGREIKDLDAARRWACRLLRKRRVATAVIVDGERVIMAWERAGNGQPCIVAQSCAREEGRC